MKPSKGEKEVIEEFQGIIDSFDDAVTLAGSVTHSFGLINTIERRLIKLGGCLPLASSCSSMGSVISLSQLTFETLDAIIVHADSRLLVPGIDLAPYAGTFGGIMEFGMVS